MSPALWRLEIQVEFAFTSSAAMRCRGRVQQPRPPAVRPPHPPRSPRPAPTWHPLLTRRRPLRRRRRRWCTSRGPAEADGPGLIVLRLEWLRKAGAPPGPSNAPTGGGQSVGRSPRSSGGFASRRCGTNAGLRCMAPRVMPIKKHIVRNEDTAQQAAAVKHYFCGTFLLSENDRAARRGRARTRVLPPSWQRPIWGRDRQLDRQRRQLLGVVPAIPTDL